jgi:hypothetical protein
MDYIGESYMGISRLEYPFWEGWKEIDRHKTMYGFPDNLKFSDKLIELLKNFAPKQKKQ